LFVELFFGPDDLLGGGGGGLSSVADHVVEVADLFEFAFLDASARGEVASAFVELSVAGVDFDGLVEGGDGVDVAFAVLVEVGERGEDLFLGFSCAEGFLGGEFTEPDGGLGEFEAACELHDLAEEGDVLGVVGEGGLEGEHGVFASAEHL